MNPSARHPSILLRPAVDSAEVLADMLITPTCASFSFIWRRRDPLEGGVCIAHDALSNVVPAMTKVPHGYLVWVPSAETEVSFSDCILMVR